MQYVWITLISHWFTLTGHRFAGRLTSWPCFLPRPHSSFRLLTWRDQGWHPSNTRSREQDCRLAWPRRGLHRAEWKVLATRSGWRPHIRTRYTHGRCSPRQLLANEGYHLDQPLQRCFLRCCRIDYVSKLVSYWRTTNKWFVCILTWRFGPLGRDHELTELWAGLGPSFWKTEPHRRYTIDLLLMVKLWLLLDSYCLSYYLINYNIIFIV